MQCPVDGTTLMITDRSGIEIDYCPQCRGVWLDRGELDKIIERSEPSGASGNYDDDHENDRSGGRKKRGGFLSEVFDLFD